MITGKYINTIIIVVLLLAVVSTGIFMMIPGLSGIAADKSQPEYVSKLFGYSDKIITIDIRADESDWKNMLENATKEEYINCDVTINGTTFKSVGIRPKGNSSLSMVAGSDSDRFSFKFEFDHYIKGQTCFGLDKLVINNVQADATYMKEYLSYDLMSYMGVTTPLYSYTDVTVNGKDWGFYIAVEAMEEAFAERNFGDNYGRLYKPEGMGARGKGGMMDFPGNNKDNDRAGRENVAQPSVNQQPEAVTGATAKQNGQGSQNTKGDRDGQIPEDLQSTQNDTNPPMLQNSPSQQSSGNLPEMGRGFGGPFGNGVSGGTDLKYTDDKISSYSNIFDYEVFKGTNTDYKRVINALKNLNSGTDLEKYINVDQSLRYFAVNTVVVNLDSYFSNMKHNYYLYEKDGRLTMLPWDYNLAFAGFMSGSAASAVNFPIDTPVSGVEMSERPILNKLLEVDEYRDKYHEYLKEIVDGYFNSRKFETSINKLDTLISKYVRKDATAFFTHDQYTAAVAMLKQFGKLRACSIQGQLDGTIPSTTEGQSKAQDKLVDASAINLSVLGSQGGGGGFGKMGRPGQNQNAAQQNSQSSDSKGGSNTIEGAAESQDGMQPPDGMHSQNQNQPSGGNQLPNVASADDRNRTGNDIPSPHGMPGFENMPDSEIMMEAIQIIQSANGKELSEEQLNRLKELGLTEEQIANVQRVANGFGKGGIGFGADRQRGEGYPLQNGRMGARGKASVPYGMTVAALSVCIAAWAAGFIFVVKFRRKKLSR